MSAKALAAAVVLLFLALSPAHADLGARAEVFGGTCSQNAIGEGIWYQSAYPHTLDLSSGCASVGFSVLTGTSDEWSSGWRFAYVDLGTLRFDSRFAMRDDEQHLAPDGSACNLSTWSGCVGHGVGKQTARGLSIGHLVERDFGSVNLGADIGLFAYEGAFAVDIEGAGHGAHLSDLSIRWSGWQVTPYIGTMVRYGYAVAGVRWYGRVRAAEHGCGGCSGIANGPAYMTFAGLHVPF